MDDGDALGDIRRMLLHLTTALDNRSSKEYFQHRQACLPFVQICCLDHIENVSLPDGYLHT